MVVNRLYYKKDAPCFKNEGGSFSFNNKALEEAIRSIFEKELNVSSEIDRGLFNEFWRIFNEAADSGFGVPPVTSPEYMFYEEIKYNNAVYSAFRTHRLQNDIAAQMLDDDGKLKDFRQFKTDVESLVAPTHLDAWLETEYDTAVLRAHLAADWHQFEQNKDILPNLRWVPSTSVEPGLDHRMFWNIIRPVDDAFWDNHRPGDRWNCKCDLEATDEPATDKSDIPQARDSDKPKDGLENNPGKDAKLFSENNPYQKHAYPGARKAVDRFVNENIHRPEEKTFQSVQKYKNGGEVLLH
ncbi:phage head morphogenesis protein, partial [Parabacteroides sp. OttesenSCG-928-B22]|nr:phage head morphogenesis protein [Parabacteroides sp. OttesenSCG-928-B22]